MLANTNTEPQRSESDEILTMFKGLSIEEAEDLVDDAIAAIIEGIGPWKMSQEEASKLIKKLVRALIEHKVQAEEVKAKQELEPQKESK